MRTTKIDKQQACEAGQNYVAFEIHNRGGRAEHINGNRKGFDLYASDADDRRHIAVQVKTKTGRDWQINKLYGPREEEPENEINFWVMVDLSADTPQCYVMPAWWIEDDIHFEHEWNLKQHGGVRPKNPNSAHQAISVERVERWKDRWDVMGIFPT